jgi:protease-4
MSRHTRFLEINLNNRTIRNRLRSARRHSIIDLFAVIERAGKDKRIGGLLVNASGFTADREYLWELRGAIENFRKTGKKVCAFIAAANLDLYCLASAADRIVMDQQGVLQFFGYAWGRAYMRQTLDKIGIGVREFRYFEYKSAAETFTRDSLSEADRKQYGEYLDDIFTLTRDTLVKARFRNAADFDAAVNREYLYSARSALERGLVDLTGRKDAVVRAVQELEGTETVSWFRFGDADTTLMGSRNPLYRAGRRRLFSPAARIALIYASGQTDLERGMAARCLVRTIEELSEKKSVKAIVVRIDSPGGSADAADSLAEAIRAARERMPVVVSMGAVAASGGYWAAMYADHITASPYTLTGSIGVIGSWFFDKGLNKKLGFSLDTLRRGDHADLFTGFILPQRDLDDAEAERYRIYILDLYRDFVEKAAAGRKMSAEQIEAVAQGRVFSGLKALNAGLVDSVGGLFDAIHTACSLAGIPGRRRLVYDEYPKPKFIDTVLMCFAAACRIEGAGAFDMLEDLRYRISRNGEVMPIMPLYTE